MSIRKKSMSMKCANGWHGFQRPNPFSKSIYDNIAFALRRHGEKNKKKLDEIVETSLKQAALWDQVKDSLDKVL